MDSGILLGLLKLAQWVCDESTLANIVEPMLADAAYEFSSTHSRVKRAFISVRWTVGMCQVVLLCALRRAVASGPQWWLRHVGASIFLCLLIVGFVVARGTAWFAILLMLRGYVSSFRLVGWRAHGQPPVDPQPVRTLMLRM